MSFRPDTKLPPIQDMAPPGGFPDIDIKRTARARGPSGAMLWGLATAGIMYGFSRVGSLNKERSAEMLEERRARYAMASILQAEEDKWYTARQAEIVAKEAEIMKDVPGWKVGESVYNSTDRWVPPNVMPLSRHNKK